MKIYYNDNNPECCAWLHELMRDGLIPEGHIDNRSVCDVEAIDLREYDQCHFFAGIGGWVLAFELAGWHTARSVWSASLPCQPFSNAGKGRKERDERHLWPAFHDLVAQCRPAVLAGEQIASSAGRAWLSAVFHDLEDLGYACAGADLCASSIGAPHIRQRLFWLAYANSDKPSAGYDQSYTEPNRRNHVGRGGALGGMGNTDESAGGGVSGSVSGAQTQGGSERRAARGDTDRPAVAGKDGRVAHSDGGNPCAEREFSGGKQRLQQGDSGNWEEAIYLPCRDQERIVYRPVEADAQSRAFEMDDGIPACLVRRGDQGTSQAPWQTAEASRMRISGYGNAIVPQLAAVFLMSAADAIHNARKTA